MKIFVTSNGFRPSHTGGHNDTGLRSLASTLFAVIPFYLSMPMVTPKKIKSVCPTICFVTERSNFLGGIAQTAVNLSFRQSDQNKI